MNDEDRECLADFARAAATLGIKFMLIGAGARILVHDEPLKLRGRSTTDWDLALEIESWDDFHRLHKCLAEDAATAFSKTETLHRFRHRTGCLIDIIPFGGVETPEQTIVWPGSNTTFSTAGLSEASRHCEELSIEPSIILRIATLEAQIVLKAHAYLDRSPQGIYKDLEDFYHLISTADQRRGMNERVFGEALELIHSNQVDYEDTGAFLVGFDLRATFPSSELKVVEIVARELTNEFGTAINHILHPLRSYDNESDSNLRRSTIRKFSAFLAGLSTIRQS